MWFTLFCQGIFISSSAVAQHLHFLTLLQPRRGLTWSAPENVQMLLMPLKARWMTLEHQRSFPKALAPCCTLPMRSQPQSARPPECHQPRPPECHQPRPPECHQPTAVCMCSPLSMTHPHAYLHL